MRVQDDRAIAEVEERQRRRFHIPAIGLLQALKVTLRTMLSRTVTVHYPEEHIELPPRSRGVIALLEENCTVCMLCAKECPCWCIYIEGHKEQKPGKRKPVNALDRFAIDYGLCMYCGICVEVCPFDALHWAPNFEYTAYAYEGLVHEADVLKRWENAVPPPSPLVDDADEANRQATEDARAKRGQGVYGVIREADKREEYLRQQGPPAAALSTPAGAAPSAGASDTLPDHAPPEADAAGPETPPAAGPSSAPTPAAGPVPAAGAAGDVPRIDPMNLPPGISPVERGRLKKLAVLQERGETPPADLVANLRHILDQMRG